MTGVGMGLGVGLALVLLAFGLVGGFVVMHGVANPIAEAPLTFLPGPGAGAKPYVSVEVGSWDFRMSLAVTNASSIYYTGVLIIKVHSPGYLSLTDVRVSGGDLVKDLVMYVGNCSLEVLPSPSGGCMLDPGTYEVSVLVVPNTPVHAGQVETVVVEISYEMIGTTSSA